MRFICATRLPPPRCSSNHCRRDCYEATAHRPKASSDVEHAGAPAIDFGKMAGHLTKLLIAC